MDVKLKFLGTGAAFTQANFHNNALLTVNGNRLLIDAGSDIRRSLHAAGEKPVPLDLYISHLHADHAGGVPDLALLHFFLLQDLEKVRNTETTDDSKKTTLYGVGTTLQDGWNKCWSGACETMEMLIAELKDFFNVSPIPKNKSFDYHGLEIQPVQTVHVMNGYTIQHSWGLKFTTPSGVKVFYTGDTQFAPKQLTALYDWADIIFHDCETSPRPSNVHAHYNDLKTLPPNTRSKMWLMHFQDGDLPDAKADGFAGFAMPQDEFDWSVPKETDFRVIKG